MDERSYNRPRKVWRYNDGRNKRSERKILSRFIVDVQEELMDAILYLESARHCLQDEIEEALYAKARRVNENINNINIYDETIF